MNLRTIMIFPEFDNIDIIDEIREKYDPLSELVRPHMTVGKLDDAKQLNDAFNSVKDIPITVSEADIDDYICITDMAAAKSDSSRAADVIKNWLRNRNTLEFLGTWEQIYNSDFKVVEFDHFKAEAGLHTFVLSASEWIDKTNAMGLFVKKGRYALKIGGFKTECANVNAR